jgi:hypothetical protein
MAKAKTHTASDVMSENGSIVFGQVCESMKLVHKYLKKLGIDVKWKDDKFDEATGLALLVAQNQLHVFDFIEGGGFNSDSSRYKQGSTVVIRTGAKFYSDENAEEPAGVISLPTSGILKMNSENNYGNYYDSNGELQFGVQSLNPLKITLLPSPLEDSASSIASILGKSNNNKVSASGNLINTVSQDTSKYGKKYGGYQAYSIVYLRKDDVCPSFSDMMISDNFTKIMKAGEIVSQGIDIINDVTDIGSKAAEFLPDECKALKDFLKDTDGEYSLFDSENKKKEELRKQMLAKNNKEIKPMTFNQNGMFIKNLITDTMIYIPFRPDSVDESYTVNWEEANTRGSSHQVFGYESTTGSAPSLNFEFDVGALASYLTKNFTRSEEFEYTENTVDLDGQTINGIEQIALDGERGFIDGSLLLDSENATYGKTSLKTIANISDEIFQIVNDYINALKALAYPKYTNGIVTPPSCYVSIANNFRFVAICTAVNISHKGPMYIKRPNNYLEQTSPGDTRILAGQQIYMNYSVTLNFNKISNQDFSADTVEVYGDNWSGGQSVLDSGNQI